MKQSEIWLIGLEPVVGAEMKKTRPVVIINNDELGKLPLKLIAPITDWKAHYAKALWMIHIPPDKTNKLKKDSAADCFQIRSVSVDRFIKKLGSISDTQLKLIQHAVAQVVSS
jgi:mRNA interferase MazF